MLVLSRRESDQIVFPNLGISVHVVRIQGKKVRLGIDAPSNIPVLRREVAEQWNQWQDYPAGKPPKENQHALRNRLNAATLGLHLLHKQLQAGQIDDAEPTIFKIFRELESIDKEFGGLKVEAENTKRVSSRRALLVEDDQNECELLAGYLRTCDFDVTTAGDGADALEYLNYRATPDIVLLDMSMPRMDGPTTISEIRGNPRLAGLKVFAVSGRSNKELGIRVGPTGVDQWFRKPINPESLVDGINRELRQEVESARR